MNGILLGVKKRMMMMMMEEEEEEKDEAAAEEEIDAYANVETKEVVAEEAEEDPSFRSFFCLPFSIPAV